MSAAHPKPFAAHMEDMRRFLDRLAEKPIGRNPYLRVPRGVTIWVGKKRNPYSTHRPVYFGIASRGRTGAADRLALRTILMHRREPAIHEGWLNRRR